MKKTIVDFLHAGKPAVPAEWSWRNVCRYGFRAIVFWGLIGCSLLYQGAIHVRVALYRRKILRQAQLPCPVISVGNITTGGTGKTPAVIEIARILAQHQKRVAVLSRGYQRENPSQTVVVEPDSDVSLVGDEPLLMTRTFRRELGASLPCPAVIVGSRRDRSGQMALERFQSDVMLLDDGFQHLRLARDCDVVLIDATNPFGGGYMLPAGFLREPIAHLRRASAVVITRSNEAPELEAVVRTLETLSPELPIFTAVHAFGGVRELGEQAPVPVKMLAQRRLLAVSGLGNPDSFHRLLRAQGLEPLAARVFPDHHCYHEADGLTISRICRAQKLDAIVTSEKDEHKLLPLVKILKIPCYVLSVKFAIQPETEFKKFLLAYL